MALFEGWAIFMLTLRVSSNQGVNEKDIFPSSTSFFDF